MVHCVYEGDIGLISKSNCISFPEDLWVLINNVDTDEMPHYAAFHLSLHCLPKFTFRSH